MRFIRGRGLLTASLMIGGLGGCAGDRAPADDARATPPLLVLAASDLQPAMGEIVTRYEERTGRRVTVAFGSTGNLSTQIEHGAPADLFFAANESFLDRLIAADLVDPRTRTVYAVGRLALVWSERLERPGRTASTPAEPPRDIGDLLHPAFETVAIANPEHAPYGVAAREALRAVGVWDSVQGRLIYGDNIVQTHQFVRTGNADVGIVALGLVLGADPRPHVVIPDTLHAPLRQAAGVLRATSRPAEAKAFLDFVMGPEGAPILTRYGFRP